MLVSDLLETEPAPLAIVGVLESSYRIGLAARAADLVLTETHGPLPEPPEATDSGEHEDEPAGLNYLGDVVLVGFGLAPETVELMQARIIHATLAERRYYLGYLLPYVLYGFDVLGAERTRYILTPHLVDERRLHLGLDAVLATELDEYFQYTRQLSGR
jgi:hypothetical protein